MGNWAATSDKKEVNESEMPRKVYTWEDPTFKNSIGRGMKKIEREIKNQLFLPREIISMIFEYSSILSLFQSLRLVCVDFFNISLDGHFCELYETRIRSTMINGEDSEAVTSLNVPEQLSFSDALLLRYYHELLPVIGLEMMNRYKRQSQRYADPDLCDTRVVRFWVQETDINFYLEIEIRSERRSYHGQGGGVSNVYKNVDIHRFLGKVTKVVDGDGEEEDNVIIVTVNITNYKNDNSRTNRTVSYHGDREGQNGSGNDRVGLDLTELRNLQVKGMEVRSPKDNISIQIMFDENLKPFTGFTRSITRFAFHDMIRNICTPGKYDIEKLDIKKVIKTFYLPSNEKSKLGLTEFGPKSDVTEHELNTNKIRGISL